MFVSLLVNQPRVTTFLHKLIQMQLKNYVKKYELSYQNLQAECILSIQSSLTQWRHFSWIFISFDIFVTPFHPIAAPLNKDLAIFSYLSK